MDNFMAATVVLIALIIYFGFRLISSEGKASRREKNSASTKINLIIGDAPPPNAVVFYPDGTIGQAPDSSEIRNKWIVQKMSRKIEQEPDDGEWYFERGKALMALGKYAEAVPDFDKLVELFPTGAVYYQLRGLCYFHSEDKEHALEDLMHYKELSKTDRQDEEAIKILCKLEKEIT
jgi:hypothetical protein